MASIEQKSKKRRRKHQLQSIVLGTIATAGLIGIAAVAPNAIGAMGKMGILPYPRQKESINRVRDQLLKKGMVYYEGKHLKLTKRGEDALQRFRFNEYRLPKPARWDKRWRILIFDIPEKRKSLRDKVRTTLDAMGFVRLQDSVWLYPYDCEEYMTLLKTDFKIGKDVLYIIADSLEYDQAYRKHFNL